MKARISSLAPVLILVAIAVVAAYSLVSASPTFLQSPLPSNTPTATQTRTSTPTRTPTRTATRTRTPSLGALTLRLPIIMKQYVPGSTPAIIFSDNFDSGTLSGWTSNGGGWYIESNYLRGVLTTSNAWNIKNASGSNFTYEGDVNIISGNAVGLTFRSSPNGTSSYDAILDVVDGVFKISKRPGYIVLASYPWPVSRNHWYHVKVVVNGNTIEGYLNGVKRLTATDNNFASGQFGVMLFCATAAYDNLEARGLP